MTFKVLGLNHLGLAPKDPKQAKYFFDKLLSLSLQGEEEVTEQQVNTVMYASSNANESKLSPRLEILEPTSSESPIQKFLEKKGSGIHHLALEVDNLEAALSHLLACGIEMIDQKPRSGAHNTQIAFVHPRATGGLLVELVQQL